MKEEQEKYAQRGMSLAYFEQPGAEGAEEGGTTMPYLINIDEDSFRTQRVMWIFDVQTYTVGTTNDIRPSSISVVEDHCEITRLAEDSGVSIKAMKGKVYVNGKLVEENESVELQPFDRVAVGTEVFRYHWVGHDPEDQTPMEDHDCIREFFAASANVSEADKAMFEEQQRVQAEAHKAEMEKMEAEFQAKLEAMQKDAGGSEEEIAKAKELFAAKQAASNEGFQANQAMSGVQLQIQEMMRKAPQASQMCQMLDRPMLGFEVKLSPGGNGEGPKPKMAVRNSDTGEMVYQDPWEFDDRFNIVQDELAKTKQAVQFGTDYEVPTAHDPLTLLFDNIFKIGNADFHLMEASLLMETEDTVAPIRSIVAPFNPIGNLEVKMTPIKGPDDPTPLDEDAMIDEASELLGKPWTYLIEIKEATKLEITSDETFVQYYFNKDLFNTEVMTEPSKNVKLDYKQIHHVPSVDQEFIDYLENGRITYDVFVNPSVADPKTKVSSTNSNIRKFLGGEPVAGNAGGSADTSTDFSQQKAAAEQALAAEKEKVKRLEAQIAELEKKVAAGGVSPTTAGQPSEKEKALEAEVAKLKTDLAKAPQSGACTIL